MMLKSKYFGLGLLALSYVKAGMVNIMENIQQAIVDKLADPNTDPTVRENLINELLNMGYTREQIDEALENSERSFAFFIEPYLATIDNYGCWCYFEDEHIKGKGPVVNTVDSYCKTMVYGYECAIMDGETTGNTCNTPWDEPYIPHNVAITPVSSVAEQCAANNPGNSCHIWACIVEGHMTEQVFADFISLVVYDPTYKHSNNFFDPEDSCHIIGTGSGQSEKSCCGNYPYRFPYKTYNNERACCGQKTYNVFNKCCEDPDDSLLLSAGSCT